MVSIDRVTLFPHFIEKFKRQICILEHDFLIIFLLILWKWLFNWNTWPAGVCE